MVLDTSVVLNLLASGEPRRLLNALNATCYVTPQVIAEVTREPALPHQSCTLAQLLDAGVLCEYPVAGDVLEAFIALAGAAPPDGLDDGEASSIAAAEALDCEVSIDEKKATRIARLRRPEVAVWCTVSIFRCIDDKKAIADDDLTLMVFHSLKYARMRVPFEHGRWVVDRIGNDRAQECSSLARFWVT